ncbi:MAG: hypothetical protein OXC68_05975, partial [Aestuariivita sp.]|nr:hypothetical protein [Aestuariivita sp.]
VRSSIQWVQKGLFERSVRVLSDAFDRSVVSVDSTILQAHAKASGSEKGAHTKALGVQRRFDQQERRTDGRDRDVSGR